MRTDYFDDLLPASVTHVTHTKSDCVTPETYSATSENSNLPEASRTSRTSRIKTDNTGVNETPRTLRVFQYRLTDNPDAWLVLIAPGCDLAGAQRNLRARFGDRLIDARKHNHDAG